jgi:PAS domain-containing protein
VKIDRSFVVDVANDPADAVLVRLVIEAAHSLGVRVCAEGVERPEQFAQLAAMGCDAVQGYLLAVPRRVPQHESKATVIAETGSHPLLAGAEQLVLTCDRTGRIAYVSSEAVQMLGYSRGELTGVDLASLVLDAEHGADDRPGDLLHLDGEVHVRPIAPRNGAVASPRSTLARRPAPR